MPLREIIAKEEDRVFAIDSECYIIFTGDTVQDRKPFIRIGNWINLPPEIIPLVENIIITDSMTGNPSHEQFNIDIKYLPTNRYIGSRRAVMKFLDYQKIFGLDLRSASVIDAEEIPEISKMNVSDRESFIGIFYRNGNFKIIHKNGDLFDLEKFSDNTPGDNKIFDRLSAQSKNRRYSGAGLAVIDNNPFFYRANSFASYLFPNSCFTAFHTLGINPKQIETIIHPSENFLGLGRFLKWKHFKNAKLALFCDSDDSSLLTPLFSKAKIVTDSFSGMKYEAAPGFNLQNIPKSYALRIDIEHPASHNKIHAAFIKGKNDITFAAKEKFDILLASCSAYIDSAVHIRANGSPAAVIDDGSPAAAKIPLMETPLLRQGIQYEIDKVHDDSAFLELMTEYLSEERIEIILKKDIDALQKICEEGMKKRLSGGDASEYFNSLSLLKFIFNATPNRKLSSMLKTNLRSAFASASRSEVYKMSSSHRIDILILNGIIYEFASKLKDPSPAATALLDDIHEDKNIPENITDASDLLFCKRTAEDRIRLRKLLALFMTNPSYRREVRELKEAIERRKKIFSSESSAHPAEEKGFSGRLREATENESNTGAAFRSAQHAKKGRFFSFAARSAAVRRISIILAAILILLTAGAASYKGYHFYLEYAAKAAVEKQKKETRRIVSAYHIGISENDIYLYVNETAVKNGYAPMDEKTFAKKNPHWIYPGNVFVLPNGEKIIVKDKDSLWNIARDKLEQKHVAFFQMYEKLKAASDKGVKPDPGLMQKAEEAALTENHKNLLNQLKKNSVK